MNTANERRPRKTCAAAGQFVHPPGCGCGGVEFDDAEWTIADIDIDLARLRETLNGQRPCDVEIALDDGRVFTVEAEWTNGGWRLDLPPEAAGQGVQVRLKVQPIVR